MPSEQVVKRTMCHPCEHLKSELFVSGRNPVYRYNCKHPQAANYEFQKTAGRLIGETDEQPIWCPLLNLEAA